MVDRTSHQPAQLTSEPNEWLSVSPPVRRYPKKNLAILGLIGCPHAHDSAAALIVNNHIVAAVEEERFAHIKHIGAYPYHSIDACLKLGGIRFGEIDLVGYGFIPERFKKTIIDDPLALGPVSTEALRARSQLIEGMQGTVAALESRYGVSLAGKFHWVNHHLAHAASSFFASGFDEAVILSVDGSGDKECAALAHGKGSQLKLIHSFLDYPESLGRFYDIVTRFVIGDPPHGHAIDAGKLMGLAAYGKADPHYFDGFIRIDENDDLHPVKFDMSYFSVHSGEYPFARKWRERFGEPRTNDGNFETHHYTLAASAQWILEKAMCAMARAASRRMPHVKKLCLSGGTALNVCANRRIRDTNLFEAMFIAPAANDAGTALGAALYLNAQASDCHKYEYTVYNGLDIAKDFDVEDGLRSFGGRISFEKLTEDELCAQVADRLARNQIVGWAQGCMEFGPRALGNRSLLTNPANPLGKDIMNAKAKKREHFRPYAPSILREECVNWFDLEDSPHMLLEARVLPHRVGMVPAITHIDGSTRPQSVTAADNPRYYKLLKAFHQRTGIPMLLNTSLNGHGETIVNSPLDAVLFLLDSQMDALAIGDYLVTRSAS